MPQSCKPIIFLALFLSFSLAMPLLGHLGATETDSCLDAITLQLSRSLDHDLKQFSGNLVNLIMGTDGLAIAAGSGAPTEEINRVNTGRNWYPWPERRTWNRIRPWE